MQTIDLRPSLLSVHDQGRRGTCIAFAVTAGHEYARYVKTGLIEDLSEEALYYQSKVVDGDRDSGTSFSSIGQALQNLGQPTEDKWPYDKLRDETSPDYLPPADAIVPQFCYRATLTRITLDVNDIVACLKQGNPVAVGVPLYNSVFTAPAGRVPMPLSHEKISGYHVVLVVGCEEDVQKTDWFIFRNSWGVRWGENGYGYLKFDYITNFGCIAYVVENPVII